MSPQPPRILIYRMMGSTHPTISGRTFAIAIPRSGPMHLHGWKVQWSHRLWCRLHTMFTARVQGREITIRRDLTLRSDAAAMVTYPSSDHCPYNLTCILANEAFTTMAMPLERYWLFFFKLLIFTF